MSEGLKSGEMGAHELRGSSNADLHSRVSKYRGVSRNGKKWQVGKLINFIYNISLVHSLIVILDFQLSSNI
jgi:hypothetical protein